MSQMTRRYLLPLLLTLLTLPVASTHGQTVPEGFSVITISGDLDTDAVGFALLPDERILVVHQFSGEVHLLVNGVRKEEPLLTVPNLETSSEKGLLGVAVDPDFPDEPHVYLFHSHTSQTNRVSRFTVTGDLQDPNSENLTIDVGTQVTLIDDMPADNFNHNGGTLRFGSDKTLYVSHGDDATRSRVQDLTTLNGKILRINRDGSPAGDNPAFPSEPSGMREEIFAFGLRNPFRFALDPESDRLFIGDVGENSREEVNLSDGGENFGWPRFEGTLVFDSGADLIDPQPTPPIRDYPHGGGRQSVIALVTYRQKDYPNDFSFPEEFDGTHFYADYFEDWLDYLSEDAGVWTNTRFGTGFTRLVDGTLGPDGAIYVLESGGGEGPSALKKIIREPQDTAVDDDAAVPHGFALEQNHPNPFNPSTSITFRLATGQPQPVRLRIYDLRGRVVVTLVDAVLPSGEYTQRWDGRDGQGVPAASGLYLYKLEHGSRSQTRKMLLIR